MYYRILPEGEVYLRALVSEYESITAGIRTALDRKVVLQDDEGGVQND